MTDWHKRLEEMTGYKAFKPGQLASLEALDRQENVVAILPTGGGKSLIYQINQYNEPGVTLIISPLISLMQDQVSQLQRMGLGRGIALNSTYDRGEQAYILSHLSDYQFLFLSPEMLLKDHVIRALQRMDIQLLVVDEAHCISQWGYDFRPQYTELKKVRQLLKQPKTLALSATANQSTLADIKAYLFEEGEPIQLVKESVDRPNIFYLFDEIDTGEVRVNKLQDWLDRLPKPGIVYVHHKSELEELNQWMKDHTDLRVASYHGDRSLEDRHIIQSQFLQNELDVVFATSAFGMGINHGHIRFVLHYHLPKNMADFIQEVGRAGRDQEQSVSIVLYDNREAARLQQMRRLLEDEADLLDDLLERLFKQALTQSEVDQYADSVSAMLYFYRHHFTDYQTAKVHAQKLRQERLRQIYQMLDLMANDQCYRTFLLDQADEQVVDRPDLCCSNCQPDYASRPIWQDLMALPNRVKVEKDEHDGDFKEMWTQRLQHLLS
ncbi:RecQ family ATP-dependent DNA helicase [Aerococcus viridans]|nr:RecQ family ATP-dependent DNA helicase [Aerococcus viridans]